MARFLSGMLAAASLTLGAAGPARAQVGLSTKPDYDRIYTAERFDENARREVLTLHASTVEALNAGDYDAAETSAAALAKRNPTTTDAQFLLGLARIGLEKWQEARAPLEAAVKAEPRRPEPKTRLGLAYLRLDNPEGARRLREELAALDRDCKGACPDAAWIADGLRLLDQALAPGAAPVVASAASPAAAPAAPFAVTTGFDPASYSLVTFEDSRDLYDLLTQPGRCAPKQLAEPRQPCALILYRPDEAVPGARAANFKPVFSVLSRTSIWAIHDRKLQKVKIEDLYFDSQEIVGEAKAAYRSVAVIGNAENRANCEKGLPCLSQLVAADMFQMYRGMPDSVVQVIWGGGMKDPGTVRVR